LSTPAQAFCPVCGQPSPGGVVHPFHTSTPTRTGGPPAKKSSNRLVGCLSILIVIGAIGYLTGNKGSGGSSQQADPNGGGKHLTGTFLRWDPVDEGDGYAYFSITNTGTVTETAECSVSVKDDFGDFGFDSLVGETVGPGQTVTGKLPLSVGKGSFLINSGEVKSC
jgi:hypothetical protein